VRFSGHLRLQAAGAGGRTALAGQSFRAPYHVSKAYWDADAGALLVQVVNPTAGILEGDHLESEVVVEAGASLVVTTPSASRVFRMKRGSADCRQRYVVAAGGWLEVVPEPLVPHRGCRYRQETLVEVEPGSGAFLVDLLMPGRTGHGESWAWESLCLLTEVRLCGELVLRERFEQTGAEMRALAALAGSGPRACFGNAVLVGEGEAPWRRELETLHGDGLWLGVSPLRRGGWSIKFVAADSVRLRHCLHEVRRVLAAHHPRLRMGLRKL
jgi:urease accessory protein